MMDWVFTEHIYWLLILIIAGVFLLIIQSRSEKIFTGWIGIGRIKGHHPILRFFLNMGALLFISIAMLGPSWGINKSPQQVIGREIYFLVDVSASMNAYDLKPSRLEKVKAEIRKMATRHTGDLLGLIVFTSHGYIQCPLTHDHASFSFFVDLMETEQFSNTGTDLRAGLSKALERFSEDFNSREKPVSRALVILTDGEHFGDNYTSVILRLRDRGVHVIPVAVGSDLPVPVPIIAGSEINKTDARGLPVTTRVQIELLEELARQCRSPLYRLKESGQDLIQVSQAIQNLPLTLLGDRLDTSLENRFQWFLLPGICMFLLALFLMPKTRL